MGLYKRTQALLRFGFWLYYKRVHVMHIENVPDNVPALLVANHPNSFMDALVIGSYLKRPTHFLARGDAFNNRVLAKIFHAYHMLPVYRISEGKENVEKNFETFDVSYEVLKNRGVMLIFGEGLCKNNWDLRPLKKGPARIANRAWSGNDAASDLQIVPVGLTYQHFDGGGKSVVVNYGKPITKDQLLEQIGTPQFVSTLNDKIATELKKLAYINPDLQPNSSSHHAMMHQWDKAESKLENVLLAVSDQQSIAQIEEVHMAGINFNKPWLTPLHYGIIGLPHYLAMKLVAKKLTKGSVFFDSIFFGLILFLFPIYWITIIVLAFLMYSSL